MSAAAVLATLPPGLVWHADRLARAVAAGVPTGFAALDAELPGGGWPRGALIELLSDAPGIGELGLLLPVLRAACAERWIVWIAPPYLPYAPALAAAGVPLQRLLLLTPASHRDTLWAIRQALASGGCTCVLAWLPRADTAALRRLQLAAEDSATPLFLFRPASAAQQSSPASLRLRLAAEPASDVLTVDIFKRRGPALAAPIRLVVPDRPGVWRAERICFDTPAGAGFPINPHAMPSSRSNHSNGPQQPFRLNPSNLPHRPNTPNPSNSAALSISDALVCADPVRTAAAGIHARRG